MNQQYEALKKLPVQIRYSLDNYTPHGITLDQVSNIVIGGLGGSGIGGRLAKAFFLEKMPVPVEVYSEYFLPKYVNKNTMLILSSYSGNTEETLEMFSKAMEIGCRTLVITSGGELLEKANQNNIKAYKVEPGFMPRMALGYSLTFLVQILSELTGEDLTAQIKEVAESVDNSSTYESDATQIFNSVKAKIKAKYVVVTDIHCEAIGLRFCQQMQENAKHEAFLHVLPEANHNVIESYVGQLDTVFIFIKTDNNDRVNARFEFLTSLLEVEYNKVINISLPEYNLKSIFGTIFRLDWLSLYIADLKKVDSYEVPNIMSLKDYLQGIEG